jgi:maleylacetoacetate isomerase
MKELILYSYWRSSAAYRVRIALNLKQLAYKTIPIHLVEGGGQQHSSEFASINANELVPVLVDGDLVVNQSLSIIDYLDELSPKVLLTPKDSRLRYQVKSLAQDIAIDIHPINNLRVMQYLTCVIGTDQVKNADWTRHWIERGFTALEKKLQNTTGSCCVGDDVTLVDVCLVPQVYNALRFGVVMTSFPIITRVYSSLIVHPAFIAAAPENQPDAQS